MADTRAVAIDGLREVRDDLKEIDRSYPRVITRAAGRAARIVRDRARDKAPVFSGEARTPKRIRESIVSRATQLGAGVAFGGPDAPHAFVHEFGGTIRRRGGATRSLTLRTGKQKGTTITRGLTRRERVRRLGAFDRAFRRGKADDGRTHITAQPYMYPAIAESRADVRRVFTDELATEIGRLFPVTGA